MSRGKTVVKRLDLRTDQIYYLDNYSKAQGKFHSMLESEEEVVIAFNPIECGNYTVEKGLITFRFKKPDNNIVFYQ